MSMSLSVFISRKSNLSNSAELCFGIKNLQRQLQLSASLVAVNGSDQRVEVRERAV